ncbi:MAG: hypothetical protein IPL78_24225 [Chloroflexi bacterium]|nr:hypothetical protein [Chloroflexota bacterium]
MPTRHLILTLALLTLLWLSACGTPSLAPRNAPDDLQATACSLLTLKITPTGSWPG